MKQHKEEVEEGKRFQFGDNWMRFLEVLNEERIVIAEKSLQQMLGIENLQGKTFLDAGSGSGLFSFFQLYNNSPKAYRYHHVNLTN